MARHRRKVVGLSLASVGLLLAWVASVAAAKFPVARTETANGLSGAPVAQASGPESGSLVLLGAGFALAAQMLKRQKPGSERE